MKFKTAENKLRRLAKKRFSCLSYERTYFSTGEVEQKCSVYVNGYDWYPAPTWEQAFILLKQAITRPVVDVQSAPTDELPKEGKHENNN